jgi:tyrocidine synthetase III
MNSVDNKASTFPLSCSQQSIWLHQRLTPNSNAYNIPVFFRIKGTAGKEVIESAIRHIISKYDILRVQFQEIGGKPIQTVCDLTDGFPVELFSENDNLKQQLIKYVKDTFNIEKAPLFRFAIIETDKKEIFILMVFHHLITDGTSLYLLAQEIRHTIDLFKKGQAPEQQKNSDIDYSEYINIENQRTKSDELIRNKEYWLENLKGELTYLSLPYDSIINRENRKGATSRLLIDKALKEKLELIAKESNSSLYSILLSGFVLLLYRLTGEQEIIIGTPVINRDSNKTSKSQGLFLNTLMLRNYVNPDDTISHFIKKVKSNLFQALRHRSYPFSNIIKDLKIKSDCDMFPISNVFFNGLTFFDDTLKEEAFEAFSDNFGLDINFDLDCYVTDSKEKLLIRLDYRKALFNEETIDLFLQKYRHILEQIYTKYKKLISTISYNTSITTDNAIIDAEWYKPGISIIDVFYQQVEKNAYNIAVKADGYSLTYRELNEITNQWAQYLLAISNDERVAICVAHNYNIPISVLSVLKAGKSYIPLDISYPESRIVLLLKEVQTSLVITDSSTIKAFSGIKGIKIINLEDSGLCLDQNKSNLRIALKPLSEAYIMYTSGSTGKAKGVVQLHKNVLHYISQYTSVLGINPNDNLTGFSPITYDSFNNDFYGAMLNGATYCPLSIIDYSDDMRKWVCQNEITIWHSVPGVFRMYAQEWIITGKLFDTIRIVKMTGDFVRLGDFESFKKLTNKNAKFVVSLGSTESTLTCINLFGHDDSYTRQLMPVGYSVARTKVLVVNNRFYEQDILEPGQLIVESDFITSGYFNDPALNNTIFYKRSNKRYYCTGDIGRKLIDGRIEWLCRIDGQLKINGIRIEPGEIENHLLSIQGIKEVLVIQKEFAHGEKCLCAYYTADKEILDRDFINHLSYYLPQSIIPSCFTRLDKFTYNLHGKLDRKGLPEPILKRNNNFFAPRNVTEVKLVKIFAELLNIKDNNISVKDSFFELGGHSLKAIQLIHRLHKTFNKKCELRDVFKHPTIASLAEMVKKQDKVFFKNIIPLPEQENYELSHAQRCLWILGKLSETSGAYHISNAIEIKGEFDKAVFQSVLISLINRHEVLRTIFIERNGLPVQKVLMPEQVEFSIKYEDVSNETNIIESAGNLVDKDSTIIFDYTKAPLMRALLIKLEEGRHVLLLTLHHIISDGWSMEILTNEIRHLFEASKKGITPNLPVLNIQYKDYAAWHNQLLKSDLVKEHKDYWLKQFEGEVPLLDLPTDKPRPSVQTYNGTQVSFKIPVELTNKLKKFANQHDATLFMTLIAVIKTLLFRYTGQNDIVIGTATAGRNHVDLESQLGFYVNTIALRTSFNEDDSFVELVNKIKEVTIGAFDHSLYTLDYLVEDLKTTRDLSRNALFDVMVVLQNERTRTGELTGFEGLELYPFPTKHVFSKFDLTFNILELGDIIRIDIEYNNDLYTSGRIKSLIDHFLSISDILLNHSRLKINSFNYITEIEKKFLLEELNNTGTSFPKDKTIIDLFEKQVTIAPDSIAVVYGREELTYGELNSRANQLGWLIIEKGLKRECIVAIMAERSIELIVGIFGILKSGCAYLPIDPNCPVNRKKFIIENSKATIILTQECFLKTIEGDFELINLNDTNIYQGNSDNLNLNTPSDIAYVIYTSGSTGNPKGVMIEHGSLFNRLFWMQKKYSIGTSDTILQKTPYTFDVSVWEIFWWSITGSKVCMLVPGGEKDPKTIRQAIHSYHISVLHFIPSMLNAFLEEVLIEDNRINELSSVKLVITSGEALLPYHVEKFNNSLGKEYGTKLTNLYGPTEATIDVTYYDCPSENPIHNVPIGKPIDNIKLYIINKEKFLQPIGIVGELCIGGIGLARGYLFNETLTKERFISSPFKDDERIYKTGDLAKWLPNGNIEFLGRMDYQVKIRGNRIELGEIETQLLRHKKIKECAVIARSKENEKYLCAYIVTEEEIEINELRTYLSQSLPDYMVPSYFEKLNAMPLTPNGKVDYKALPEPEIKAVDGYIAPSNEIEEKLVTIWSEVLKIDKGQISLSRSFFELGGHSLKATLLVNKILKELKVEVPLREVFNNQDIISLGKFIENTEKSKYFKIEKAILKDQYKLSSAQKRLFFLHEFDKTSLAYNMPQVAKLEGKIDKERLNHTFNKLIARHESLRTSFELINEEAVQKISDKITFEIEYFNSDENGVQQIIKDFIRPFDLSKAPLINAGIIETSPEEHVLMVDMHHIVTDGISQGILIKDFMALYNEEELPELKLQYKDYAEWQQIHGQQEKIVKQKAFWLNEFADELITLELPTDFKRPLLKSYEGNAVDFKISSEETSKLKSIAQTEGVSLFMVLLSIYNILLSKLSNQEDIVVGTPVAGRQHFDLENMIGMFVNTLPLRNFPKGALCFREFLLGVKNNTMSCFDNQSYQYEELIVELNMGRDTGRNPLIENMFVLQNFTGEELKIQGLTLQTYKIERNTSKFDLMLTVVESQMQLFLTFEYCTKLFRKETIERFIVYFKRILSAIIIDQNKKISEIEIILEKEKHQLLYEFNKTKADYSKDKTIIDLFEDQVKKTPGNVALLSEGKKIIYQELNERVNKLAYKLREIGIKNNINVGILQKRSDHLIVSLLAILKSGGTYVPVEHNIPETRMVSIFNSIACTTIIIDSSQIGTIKKLLSTLPFIKSIILIDKETLEHEDTIEDGNVNLFYLEDLVSLPKVNPIKINLPTDNAYIIFTSGTTGTPKGVIVQHRPVINLIEWATKTYSFTESDRVLFTSSISFDLSVFDIFGLLSVGGSILIVNSEYIKEPLKIAELLVNNKITFWDSAPQVLQQIILCIHNESIEGNYSDLRLVFISGDWIPLELPVAINQYFQRSNFVALGGATEATVWSNYFNVTKVDPLWSSIPYGRPIQNAQYYILDAYLNLSPIGVPGNLYIGGECLAKGYYLDDNLTNSKFLQNPYCSGEKIYFTGDRAKMLADGNIEFLGRIDSQVKIRGFRIELGEIESQLLRYKGIQKLIVLAKEKEGDKYLVTYYVSEKEIPTGELRAYLLDKLPDYMVPSFFIRLNKLPLTPNGKIDRKALPASELKAEDPYIAPSNDIEEKLVEIWSEVLKIDKDQISVNRSFFELGGHSLTSAQLVNKIFKELHVEVSLREVFANQEIINLSKIIQNAERSSYSNIEKASLKEHYKLSSAQKRLLFLYEFDKTSLAYNMPQFAKLEGKMDIERLQNVFNKLIARHESFRTSFEIINDEAIQKISDHVNFDIEYFQSVEDGVPQIIRNFIKPFDLGQAPLIKVGIIETSHLEHILMIDMHHIITDGVSQEILIKDFMALYSNEELPELRLQYKDYAEWQQSEEIQEKLTKQKAFWQIEYSKGIATLDLPTDFKRPTIKSYEGDNLFFNICSKETSKLKSIAESEGTTLFMVLLSIYNILLSKLTNNEDIVVATGVSGRYHADIEGIIGMFVNTLPIRNYPRGELSFRDFLIEVRHKTLACFDNQAFHFMELVDELKLVRDASHNPLFETLFVIQNFNGYELKIPGLVIKPYKYECNISKIDLTLFAVETNDKILLNFEYYSRLFKKETIKRFADYFLKIVTTIVSDIDIKNSNINIMTQTERNHLVYEFNNTNIGYTNEDTIISLFEEQVEKTPKNTVLKCGDNTLSYLELKDKSDKVATFLQEVYGAEKGDFIGILLDLEEYTVISILSILQAGCVYVPIDTNYPVWKIDSIIEKSGIKVIITRNRYLFESISNKCKIVNLDEDLVSSYKNSVSIPKPLLNSNDTALRLFIPDPSGKFDQFDINHFSLVNYSIWARKTYVNKVTSIFSLLTPIKSSLTFTSVYVPLISGNTIHIYRKDSMYSLIDIILKDNNVNILKLTPSHLRLLRDSSCLKKTEYKSNIKCLIISGGKCTSQLVQEIYSLFNGDIEIYTETILFERTIAGIFTKYKPGGADSKLIPITHPFDNNQIYLLDKYLKPVPKGAKGELYIGDSQIKGSFNEKKSQICIDNPFIHGRYIYKTGEYAKWDGDDNLEIINSGNRQVFIDETSIIFHELEYCIKKIENIKDCYVIEKMNNKREQFLSAYVVASNTIDPFLIMQELFNSVSKKSFLKELCIVDTLEELKNIDVFTDNTSLIHYESKHLIQKIDLSEFILNTDNQISENLQIEGDFNF